MLDWLKTNGRRRQLVGRYRTSWRLRHNDAPSVVAIGGGTGLSSLLKGIKTYTRNITAVVTVTDEGGSSGRLRAEWGVLPPGDVRNCILALAENDNELKRILNFRFDKGELAGHSLGNLLLLALTEMCGDFAKAVEQMNHLLAIHGRVLPVTTDNVSLVGLTSDGQRVKGELDISKHGASLREIWLEPKAKALPAVLKAVNHADIILLGPGSLFTSVIPNLLIQEFAQKLRESPAPKIYVSNLMTQPDETSGMNIIQHFEWLSGALGCVPDFIIANNQPIPDEIVAAYASQGATPLYLDGRQRAAINKLGCRCVDADTLAILPDGRLRHDSAKLAAVIFKMICEIYN